MSPWTPLSLLLLLLSPTTTTSSSSSSTLTAYDILEQYDLPRGLLAEGAEGYTLNTTTGAFTVRYRGGCRISHGSFNFAWNRFISMVISHRRMNIIRGIEHSQNRVNWHQVSIMERRGDTIWVGWRPDPSSDRLSWSLFSMAVFRDPWSCNRGGGNIRISKEGEEILTTLHISDLALNYS